MHVIRVLTKLPPLTRYPLLRPYFRSMYLKFDKAVLGKYLASFVVYVKRIKLGTSNICKRREIHGTDSTYWRHSILFQPRIRRSHDRWPKRWRSCE